MSELETLLRDIEKLRERLNNLIEIKDLNLQDPEIISASKTLNNEINKYNDIIKKKTTGK